MVEIEEDIIKKLKGNVIELSIFVCLNIVFAILFLILFITSFTDFGISRDLPIQMRLVFPIITAISFFAVYKYILLISRIKKILEDNKLDGVSHG